MADSPATVFPWEKLERQLQWGLYDSLRIATDSALAHTMNSRDSARLPRIWLYRGAALYGLGYSDAARECFQTAACMDSTVTLDSFYVQSELPNFYGNIRREMAEGKIACPERQRAGNVADPKASASVEPKVATPVSLPRPTGGEFWAVKNTALGFWSATAIFSVWTLWEFNGRREAWKLYSEAGARGDVREYDRQGKIFEGHNARTWIAAMAVSVAAAGGTFFTVKAYRLKQRMNVAWSGDGVLLSFRF